MRKALEIEENFSHISPGDDGPGLWLWLKLSVDGNLGSSNDVRRLFLSLSSRSTQKWIEDENKKSTVRDCSVVGVVVRGEGGDLSGRRMRKIEIIQVQ